VFVVVDLAAEDDSYTDIEVGSLKPSVTAQLADNGKTRDITSEVRLQQQQQQQWLKLAFGVVCVARTRATGLVPLSVCVDACVRVM
jgi:hypothetical protein